MGGRSIIVSSRLRGRLFSAVGAREGTFLSLLAFLERHAPDPLTRRVAELARQDEARHVAFGMAHLERHLSLEPALRERHEAAVERRHAALADTAGLNEEVFDALVILAAGAFTVDAIGRGWDLVQGLQREMHEHRRMRLTRLGFRRLKPTVWRGFTPATSCSVRPEAGYARSTGGGKAGSAREPLAPRPVGGRVKECCR